VELEVGLVSEGLETVKGQTFEIHRERSKCRENRQGSSNEPLDKTGKTKAEIVRYLGDA
jgi:hypothetical protein